MTRPPARRRPLATGSSRREHALTLSLKPESAQLLALSIDKGTVNVAVRNPDDVRVIEGATEVEPASVTAPSRSPVTAVRRPAPASAMQR